MVLRLKIKTLLFCCCIFFLSSCAGFAIQAERSINNDDELTSSDKINNVICISNDYEICQYFKTAILQEVFANFDGLIEVNIPQIQNFYSNWDNTGSPRVSKSIVRINYTIMSSFQSSPENKGVISDTVTVDTPYQFGSSVVSDLYTIRHSKKNAVNETIKIIKHSINSIS